MKYYLINENGQQSVIGVSGFIPNNSIGEVPENISPEDYQYLTHFETTIYVDENAKAFGEAQKLVAEQNIAWANLRAERNRLLAACDYTQLADSPLTPQLKDVYQVYRQALRDLPNNTIDPSNPIWPESP